MIIQLNIELTNRCNKKCYFCGHHPQKEYGDIDIDLVCKIYKEIQGQVQVQFHRDGEPLLYPMFDKALVFARNITSIVTNGKLLDKWKEIIAVNATTLVISAFMNDPDQWQQYQILKRFIEYYKNRDKPIIIVKWVGDGYDSEQAESFRNLGVLMTHRRMHLKHGDTGYQHGDPPIPEMGICQDLLYHPSIDWKGNVHICNRLDVDGLGVIGNVKDKTLISILHGVERQKMIDCHIEGRRDLVDLCSTCKYWGYPAG